MNTLGKCTLALLFLMFSYESGYAAAKTACEIEAEAQVRKNLSSDPSAPVIVGDVKIGSATSKSYVYVAHSAMLADLTQKNIVSIAGMTRFTVADCKEVIEDGQIESLEVK